METWRAVGDSKKYNIVVYLAVVSVLLTQGLFSLLSTKGPDL